MSTEDADGPLAGSRPVRANAQTTPPSRSRIGLQTILALALGCGVLWWVVHEVSSNSHGTNEAIRAMRSRDASERVSGIQRLGSAGPGNGQMAIPPLIVALGDADAQVRSEAAMALGYIGPDALKAGSPDDMLRGAVTALLGLLKDPQPRVRVAAANALASIISSEKSVGLIDHKAALVTLTESLSDPDATVRYAALGPLALVAPASGGEPPQVLVDTLKDESAGTRASAVVALACFRRGLDPRIPSLLEMIEKDKDPAVREAFRRSAASIHPPAVSAAIIPTLIAALRSPDGQVRDMACRVLMTFGPEAREAIPALIAMAREEWSDSAVVDRQILALDRSAIQALPKIALETESAGQVIAVLSELIKETSPNRSAAAVAALGEIGPAAESAVPALIRALSGKRLPSDPVMEALVRIAAGPTSARKVIAGLGGAVRTGRPEIQSATANVLGDFGPAAESAVPDLIFAIEEAAREKRYNVTWRASVALGRIAPRTKSAGEAIAALERLLRIRPAEANFQIAAADALAGFGPAAESAVPGLIQVLKESSGDRGVDRQVISSAARALVRIAPGTPSSEEAMRALTEVLPRLRAIVRDRERTVNSNAAAEALAKIEGRK
jgi:HEAT repeat protein